VLKQFKLVLDEKLGQNECQITQKEHANKLVIGQAISSNIAN
jgi:hypothetical protein